MSTPLIVRRFRKELRTKDSIHDSATVTLSDDPKREANTLACKLLLEEVFHDRITIEYSADGFVCGSREEAAIYRLQEYTRNEVHAPEMLLTEIPVADIQEYLRQHNSDLEVYVPSSPEQRFVDSLASEFEDITYGL